MIYATFGPLGCHPLDGSEDAAGPAIEPALPYPKTCENELAGEVFMNAMLKAWGSIHPLRPGRRAEPEQLAPLP